MLNVFTANDLGGEDFLHFLKKIPMEIHKKMAFPIFEKAIF